MREHFIDEMYDILHLIDNRQVKKREALDKLIMLFQGPSFLKFKKHTLSKIRQYVTLCLSESGFTVNEIAEALNLSERIVYKYKKLLN